MQNEVETLVIDSEDIINFVQKQDETYDFLKKITREETIDPLPAYFKLYENKKKRQKKRSVGMAAEPRKKSKMDGFTLTHDVVGIESVVCEEKGLDQIIDSTSSSTAGVMEVILDEEEYD